jgi:hypothetical protein
MPMELGCWALSRLSRTLTPRGFILGWHSPDLKTSEADAFERASVRALWAARE